MRRQSHQCTIISPLTSSHPELGVPRDIPNARGYGSHDSNSDEEAKEESFCFCSLLRFGVRFAVVDGEWFVIVAHRGWSPLSNVDLPTWARHLWEDAAKEITPLRRRSASVSARSE